MDYWVTVVAKNAAQNISSTLTSLLGQTLRPTRIVIVNDGSSDGTDEILAKVCRENQIVQVLTLPDHGYDIRRVPANVNLAIASASELHADYVMISGDDCVYPANYANSIIQQMNGDVRIAVASGLPDERGVISQEHSPSGSGRIIRTKFLADVGSRFPVRAGWEAWLLFKAAQMGLETQVFSDLTYSHVRARGSSHQFTYWGAAMFTLGYCPLYALGRIMRTFIKSYSLKPSLALLRGYLTAAIGSADPFIVPFDPSLRRFVSFQQKHRIGRIVASIFSRGIG